MRGHKSIYHPVNPEKYVGTFVRGKPNVVCRSSWERAFSKQLDLNPNVLKWSSEELIINYRDPVTGRRRRYFPDYVVHSKTADGGEAIRVIEIKPFKQTQKPERKSRKRAKYLLKEEYTYAVNIAKWRAAEKYCDQKGWEFVVITERDVKFFK